MLNFSPYTILFTIINLLVLWLFLRHFLFNKVTAILDNRAKAVDEEQEHARQDRAQAEDLRTQYEEQLDQARQEGADLVAQSKAQAQRESQAILGAARAEAEHMKEIARAQLQTEREAMVRGAQKEVAQLALLAAARVTQKKLDSQDDLALVDSFLAEVGDKS